jgi:hypothetical protein
VPDSASDSSNSPTVVGSEVHLVDRCKTVLENAMIHTLPSRQQALSVHLK